MLAGLEQVDAGSDLDRRPRGHRPRAEGARRRDGLPELRALSVSHGRREHRVPAADRARTEGRARSVASPRSRRCSGSSRTSSAGPASSPAGQRQRVAMGRAIIREPSVFLMDEPLSNLDAKLRVQMRAEIASLQSRLGVDHRVRHARPVRGDDARRPRRGARRRAAAAVRRAARALRAAGEHVRRGLHRLAGDEPLPVPGRRRTARSRSAASTSRCRTAPAPSVGARSCVGLRPEALELADDGIAADVEVVEEIGADAYVFASAELARRGDEARRARRGEGRAPERGARVDAPSARRVKRTCSIRPPGSAIVT